MDTVMNRDLDTDQDTDMDPVTEMDNGQSKICMSDIGDQ
jgi:hypothetical protein